MPLLNWTNGLVLPGADNLTNRVSLTNRVVKDLAKTNQLSLTLVPATGLLSGGIQDPATRRQIPFKGALFQNQGLGLGACQEPHQTADTVLRPPGE